MGLFTSSVLNFVECLVLLSTFLWFDNFLLKACVEHSAIPDYYTHGMLAQFGERFLEYSLLHNTIALCNRTFGLSYLYRTLCNL